MRTAVLINEILDSIVKLVQNIRTLFTDIKKSLKKKEKNVTI